MQPISKRVIMRVAVWPEVPGALDEFSYRTGMTKVALCSRLVEWCARQDLQVQSKILGQITATAPDVVRAILTQIASKK